MSALIKLLAAIANTVLRGVVVRSMWVWFVLTQFPQAPTISTVGAIGLSGLLGLFTISASDLDEMTDKRVLNELWSKRSLMYAFTLLILWGQAFIVHLFMS